MSFKEFLEQKEKDLINAVGYDNWYKEKVYFPHEIIKFVKEFLDTANVQITNNKGGEK